MVMCVSGLFALGNRYQCARSVQRPSPLLYSFFLRSIGALLTATKTLTIQEVCENVVVKLI